MTLEQSILKSTKKILGLPDEYKDFDVDVITHINAAFFTLTTLGLGPAEGFMIEGNDEEWADFMASSPDLNAVRSYVYLKVRIAFDPPTTSHLVKAIEDQIDELEYRLRTERELRTWTLSSSSHFLP